MRTAAAAVWMDARAPSEAADHEVRSAALIGNDEPDGLPLSVRFDAIHASYLRRPAPAVKCHGDLLPPGLVAALALVEVQHQPILAERASHRLTQARAADAHAIVP